MLNMLTILEIIVVILFSVVIVFSLGRFISYLNTKNKTRNKQQSYPVIFQNNAATNLPGNRQQSYPGLFKNNAATTLVRSVQTTPGVPNQRPFRSRHNTPVASIYSSSSYPIVGIKT